MDEASLDWRQLPNAPVAGSAICGLEELPESGGRLFAFGPDASPFRLIVLRHDEVVAGYLNRCPHFGVPLAQEERHLLLKPGLSLRCNVHYARFRWQDGFCEFGDCEGESLVAVPLDVAGGVVRIAAG